jgi:glycine/D-amino acid oxidase-like deaminating enzyme
MSDEEKNMSFQEFTAHIMRKGEARGEARGAERERALSIQRERERTMAMAAGFLSADRLDQLRGIQDPDRLVAAFAQAMRESGR